MKNVEHALVATGIALVLSASAGSAAILSRNVIAEAAQPRNDTQLAAPLGLGGTSLADNGPHGADRMSVAATYIGISAVDLHTQLAAGKSLSDIAVANGKTRDGLVAALVTAEQQSISTFVDQKGVANPGGPGHGGPGRDGRGGFGVAGDPLAVAAAFLGTTTADLHTKLQSGQTLAQIATAAGKTPDALIGALVSDAKAKIAQAKTDGKLTADQATQLETGLTDHLTKLVNSPRPIGPGPHR